MGIMFRLYYPSRIIPKNSLKIKKKYIFSINPENVIALSQQTSAFAVCVSFESLLSSTKQIGGTRAAAFLSNSLSVAGLFFASVTLLYFEISIIFSIFIGLFFSTIMLVSYLKRTADTENRTLDDFPGPRTWPISMALITFFTNQTFFQLVIVFFYHNVKVHL